MRKIDNSTEIITQDFKQKCNDRNSNIDLLRVLACIAVVGLHTIPRDLSVLTSLLYYLFGFAIPTFFISSGYFLMNREGVSWKYSQKKMFGIIKIVVIWNFLFLLVKLFKELIFHETISYQVFTLAKASIGSFFQQGLLGHFWYLGAMMIIYFLVPLLTKLSKKVKLGILILTGAIGIFIQFVSLILGWPIQSIVVQTLRLWTWLFYFILGGFLGGKNKFVANISFKIHGLILLIVTCANIVFQTIVGHHITMNGNILLAEYFYDSLFEIVWIYLMVTFILRINIPDKIQKNIINIARLTMGIYIIHFILRYGLIHFFTINSLCDAILYWLVVLAISAVVTLIIEKTFFKNFLTKI